MRKALIAVSLAALAAAGAGAAFAQEQADRHGRHGPGHMLFGADADNDGAVSRAEFDAARAAHFAELDANDDNVLTREEHRQHPRRFSRHHGPHMLLNADSDGNGVITREEFLSGPTEAFDRMDADKDGQLSAEELPQRLDRGAMEPRSGMHDPDANDDGRVSQDEFAAAGAAMFERLDANDDGSVTRAEAGAMHAHRRDRN